MTQHQSARQSSLDQNGEELARPAGAQSAKLLVVDDDNSICTVIEKLGEKAGFATTRAVSLEAATQLVRTQHFDCITLDLNVGENSGIELLGILAEKACATPIIIISGSMDSMRDFAASIGDKLRLPIQQSLGKPIDFAKLKATLIGIRKKIDAPQAMVPAE
jgi:DNA-binding response OmpR family regulator